MNEQEKMILGKIYDPSDENLAAMRLKAHKLSQQYNNLYEDDSLRKTILDELILCLSSKKYIKGAPKNT